MEFKIFKLKQISSLCHFILLHSSFQRFILSVYAGVLDEFYVTMRCRLRHYLGMPRQFLTKLDPPSR